MILTCPNCASRFLLSAQALAPEGRRVKCSSCGEEWFQQPDPDELVGDTEKDIEEIPESVKPVPEGSASSALSDDGSDTESAPNRKAQMAGFMAAFLIFAAILGALIAMKSQVMKTWPYSAGFYQIFGVPVEAPGEGLVFDKIQAKLLQSDTIVVRGNIVNLSMQEQSLPAIEVSIRNPGGEIIQKTLLHPPEDHMPGDSRLPFKSTYKGETGEADHVQLRFVIVDRSEEVQEDTESKTVSKDAGNTQAPHAGDHADPHAGEAH